MSTTRDGGLLAWQWRHYAENHRDRLNLWIHFLTVPVFVGAALAAVQLFVMGRFAVGIIALVLMAVAYGLQGLGHKRETVSPMPFAGPTDFLQRMFAEQFVTFPRFVLSRGFVRQVGGASQD